MRDGCGRYGNGEAEVESDGRKKRGRSGENGKMRNSVKRGGLSLREGRLWGWERNRGGLMIMGGVYGWEGYRRCEVQRG